MQHVLELNPVSILNADFDCVYLSVPLHSTASARYGEGQGGI